MAYQLDEMGNIIGEYESEEERRKREAANTPVKQTIVTNPDGSRKMTVTGTPEALSPLNPNTPTVSGSISPDDTFSRMRQVESGNRDFDAQGKPITSPKGAMFASQVMPATAANPGYGIRPAQNQTPEEYNRVGQEYFQALLKQFGGDVQKAQAAYNAGPGRVQQNMRANNGQMNVAQLPKETQGYLQKLGNVVSSVIPSAQAATPESFAQDTANRRSQTQMVPGLNARDDLMLRQQAPTAAVNPNQPLPDSVINDQVAAFEAKQQPQALNLPDDPYQSYIKLQENPKELINFGYDETLPENLRNRALDRATELLTQQREMRKAKDQIPTMSETEIARALREKTTGGSYIKAILFGMLGMEQSAMNEAAKLGVGKETMTTVNGEPAMVKMAANGTPIEGYNAKTGKKLSAEELVTAAQFGTLQKGANIGGQVYRDPVTSETLTKVDTAQGPIYYNKSQQRVIPKGEPIPLTAGSDVSTQLQLAQMKRQQQFVGQTASARLKAYEDTNAERALAGFPPLTPAQMGLNANGELIGQPQPTGNAPATSTTPAANAPAANAPATSTTAPAGNAPTGAALKAEREAQKTIVTDAAKQVAASADTQNMINNIEKVVKLIDTGEHNIGSVLSGAVGRGPIAQAIGNQFETTDAKNTKTIMDTVQKLAADGLKALGTNPSTIDLEFWTKFKPEASSDPEFVKQWIQSRSQDLKRRLGYADTQVKTGGQAGAAPAVNADLSPQERARQELERRKKKD